MTRTQDDQLRAEEARDLLNDFVGDLLAGTQSLDFFENHRLFAQASENMKITLRRLCVFHLVLTLSKWEDLYDRYKAIFPADVCDAGKTLRKELSQRGVRNFRNAVVGHIWDDKLKRPLTVNEVQERLGRIAGDSLDSFRLWINNPTANVFPKTVIAICERIRDRIAEENGISGHAS